MPLKARQALASTDYARTDKKALLATLVCFPCLPVVRLSGASGKLSDLSAGGSRRRQPGKEKAPPGGSSSGGALCHCWRMRSLSLECYLSTQQPLPPPPTGRKRKVCQSPARAGKASRSDHRAWSPLTLETAGRESHAHRRESRTGGKRLTAKKSFPTPTRLAADFQASV